MFRNKKRHLFIKRHTDLLCFIQQNRHAHFCLWRLDLHRQAPTKAALEPVFNAFDFFGVRVASDDHLLLAFGQCVEQIEKLFLRTALVVEELNVIYQQQIERGIALFECVPRLVLIGLDHVGNITLSVDVAHTR